VAQAIRRHRLSQNMTLEALAEKSGFTKGYLSRLENFRVSPSLSALSKLAEVLGLPLSGFFQEDYRPPLYMRGSIGDGEEIVRNDGPHFGLRYFSLAFKKLDRIMDPFVIKYSPSEELREMMMHEADEFYLVLEGSVDFFVCEMSTKETLKKGDTIYLSGQVPHSSTISSGCRSAKALVIYCRQGEETSGTNP